jgi:hypothetical protein
MELTEFLLERIADDEAAARSIQERAKGDDVWIVTGMDNYVCDYDPARVLAECSAKRRIVELHQGHHECVGVKAGRVGTVLVAPGYQFENDPTLALLALPYADHPDYDESWRP